MNHEQIGGLILLVWLIALVIPFLLIGYSYWKAGRI